MMEIKMMTLEQVPAVAALEKASFSDPWSEKSIASELDNPLSLWLTAMDGDTLCGYVGSQTVLDESDMMNVAVAENCRRRGIGQALIEALTAALKEKGSRCLTLEVRASNAPAIALYEKMGFAQIGRRPRYYHNPREDALILRKEWAI